MTTVVARDALLSILPVLQGCGFRIKIHNREAIVHFVKYAGSREANLVTGEALAAYVQISCGLPRVTLLLSCRLYRDRAWFPCRGLYNRVSCYFRNWYLNRFGTISVL